MAAPSFLHVDDLARAARHRTSDELIAWLGTPFVLWVGPEHGGREDLFEAAHTADHTPQSRSVSPADFLEHMVVPIPSRPGPLLVGRGEDCHVRIRHESVSTRHAELVEREDGTMTLRDLSSRNGTFARGALIPGHRAVTVRHGDSVQVGARVFKVYEPAKLYRTLKLIVPTVD